MAHTLNEIKRSYTGTTEAELGAAIAELTGWTYDATNHRMYLGKTRKLYLQFDGSSFTPCFISDISGQPVAVGSYQGFPLNGFTLWVHNSTNEKTTFLGMENSENASAPYSTCRFIIAENADGDEVMLRLSSSDHAEIGSKALSEALIYYYPIEVQKNDLCYGVSKLPDIWNGAAFPELYLIINTKNYQENNHLIRFDSGQIMRFIQGANGYGGLAFPVSEGT